MCCLSAELIDRYVLGRLDSTENEKVEGHVLTCAHCDQAIAELVEFISYFHAVKETEPTCHDARSPLCSSSTYLLHPRRASVFLDR